MDPISVAFISIVILFVMIFGGFHIALALAISGWIGVLLLTGNMSIANSLLANTAYEGIRQYTFSVIPLFVMMGAFISRSSIGENLFLGVSQLLRKVKGGLGVATIFANAVFAAVTGVSAASAAVFAKIAVPEMIKVNYNKSLSLGIVAGSSVLGMLVPPSLLFIIYGMSAELSIGRLFIAGLIPGILLTAIFSIGVITVAYLRPELVEGNSSIALKENKTNSESETNDLQNSKRLYMGLIPVGLLVILVLGGIWGGIFSPTEAGAVGALGALVLSIKQLRFKGLTSALGETAATVSVIFILIMCAQIYSRMLSMTGFTVWLSSMVSGLPLPPIMIVGLFCVILLVLGFIMDSTSILLITVPLMVPVILEFGYDPIWFGVIMVIVVEMGLITPPFGMCVFTVKASLSERKDITVEDIFRGSVPFVLMMFIALIIIMAFPVLTTFLPNIIYG